MDFIEFCEYILGHPLSDYQKTYFTEMYNMLKKAKEENREININMAASRGSSKFIIYLVPIYLASEYDKYLKGEGND